ncbi:MAG: PmoA family protein, partial [Planctomycetales bacterium]|nr:PmoA family protein [Planctomycetales bacterium]
MNRQIWISILVVLAAMHWPGSSHAAQREAAWKWQYREGESLSLVGAEGTVWRLNIAKSQPKVYFDPLGTVAGKSLTWNAPDDHAWHHGLWFSWKTINDVNYWEFDSTGK